MVLIQAVTKEAINTALIALQRGRDIVIGGNKTYNTISVTNNGGSGKDFTPQITSLKDRVGLLEKANKALETLTASNAEQIEYTKQALALIGLSDVEFAPSTRELTITTLDGNMFSTRIPSESFILELVGNVLTLSTPTQRKYVELPFVPTSEKGVVNGVATLDSSGRVPFSQLPESAMELKGEWNASTNTPTLADGVGTNGDFYICSTPGTVTFGTGNTVSFLQNDRVIYDGSRDKWIKLLAGQVQSVNGLSGDVVLDANNVNYDSNTTLKTEIDKKANSSSLATVATSGNYNDLTNKPTIPAEQIQSDWTQTNSASKDFIKNKIPIWITSGSADDNMTPIDSITNGSLRPVTSNAVYDKFTNVPNLEARTWKQTALNGLYVTTNASALSTATYTFTLTSYGTGNIAQGQVIRVTFSRALQSSVAITSVSITCGGRTGVIKSARAGSLVNLVSHVFTGGSYSSSYPNKVWDAYTTLELMWTGSEWLIMGNPVVCSYFSETQSYIVYANGLIKQWGRKENLAANATNKITSYLTLNNPKVFLSIIWAGSGQWSHPFSVYNITNNEVYFFSYASSSQASAEWNIIDF